MTSPKPAPLESSLGDSPTVVPHTRPPGESVTVTAGPAATADGTVTRAGDSRSQPLTPHGATPFAGAGSAFGRYRLDRVLGEGGMGAVYLAHDTALDRPVALKIPKFGPAAELAAARFLREARAAAGLQHPGICPIYDIGAVGDTHFLAMAYIPGEPLSARVRSDPPLPPAESARVVRQIALAMQYAHDRGVIHRDLKPANVMLDGRGEPVVMDFGLARRQEADAPQLTAQGDVMGTPAYMPPEQVAGDVARMGPASDVYALGAVLYELLTGGPPFRGTLYEILARVTAEVPAPPSARRPGVPPAFDAVCLRALAKQPEQRWPSLRALADALAPLAGGGAPAGGGTIALRVRGTNAAYRPPAVLPVVTVGRQRRKPGEPADQGNDFVLRVAGDDALSARISRRHFELHRTPGGWAVVDRSKAGLTRNGAPLPKDAPVALADGDELGVAGVLSLEVMIRGASLDLPAPQPGVVEVPTPAGGGGRVQLEASVGDMMTVE